MFTVQPVGWVGDWHENPAPQWIVPLSGRWWVEAMDGTRVEMGAGEFSFGEDQGCTKDAEGPQGPPLRHDRRPAGGADDGAAARAAGAPPLPHRLTPWLRSAPTACCASS